MENEILVTVLTPTYNRCSYLRKLLNSLLIQTDLRFQWLVIDDGSTDGTFDFFKKNINNNKYPFVINYLRKKNGGKHIALNYAHKYIKGKYTVIVDSDDYLSKNAIKKIIQAWKKYSFRDDIAEITFQKGTLRGKSFDTFLNGKGEYVSDIPTEMKKGFKGDHCETVRSDLFKNFQFPNFRDEKFIAEGAMWYLIARNKKVVYIDDVIYFAQYLEKGLTRSGRILQLKNPMGCQWHASVFLDPKLTFKVRFKNAILFSCYSSILNERLKDIHIEKEKIKIVKVTWLIGKLLSRYWKKKYRNL